MEAVKEVTVIFHFSPLTAIRVNNSLSVTTKNDCNTNEDTYHKRYAMDCAEPIQLWANTIIGEEIQFVSNMRNSIFIMIASNIKESFLGHAAFSNDYIHSFLVLDPLQLILPCGCSFLVFSIYHQKSIEKNKNSEKSYLSKKKCSKIHPYQLVSPDI